MTDTRNTTSDPTPEWRKLVSEPNPADGFYVFDIVTLAGLKSLVTEKRQDARDLAHEAYAFVQSRGTYLVTECNGEQCKPSPEAECPTWDGTRKSIDHLIARCNKHYPEVTAIMITGGFDGADSPREYWDGSYEPWVSSWYELVWRKPVDPTPEEIAAITRREYEAEADCGQRVYDLTHEAELPDPEDFDPGDNPGLSLSEQYPGEQLCPEEPDISPWGEENTDWLVKWGKKMMDYQHVDMVDLPDDLPIDPVPPIEDVYVLGIERIDGVNIEVRHYVADYVINCIRYWASHVDNSVPYCWASAGMLAGKPEMYCHRMEGPHDLHVAKLGEQLVIWVDEGSTTAALAKLEANLYVPSVSEMQEAVDRDRDHPRFWIDDEPPATMAQDFDQDFAI